MGVNLSEPAVVAPPQVAAQPSTAAAPTDQPALFKKAGGDWNKANDSYFEAVKELGRVNEGAQALSQRNQQLEAAVGQMLGMGGQPASTDPLMAIQNELGLPIEPIRAGIRGELKVALEELFGPIMSQHAAEETLASEIDNFDHLKGEARKYMKANPEVAETFKAVSEKNPVQAWKYAIRESLVAQGGRPAGAPSITHAGLPGGHGGSGGRVEPTGAVPDATKLAEALDYAKTYGDDAPYRHERFKGTSVQRAIDLALQQAGFVNLPPGENPIGW